MWPWEHLAFGYLLFSLYSHSRWEAPPTAGSAVVVAVATQIPDLVDKPLGWWFGVLPGGRTFAHSLLTAVPSIAVVAIVGWFLNSRRATVGFAIGYLSHLVGDVLYPFVVKGEYSLAFLFWPITGTGGEFDEPPVTHITELVADFVGFLGTPVGVVYLVVELLLLISTVAVWWRDGSPGLSWFMNRLTQFTVGSP